MLVEIYWIFNLRCGTVQRELSCVWMRCGAACRQGLRTQRSMRMHFLLSAPSLLGGLDTGDRKKLSQQEQTFFNALLFIFARLFPV